MTRERVSRIFAVRSTESQLEERAFEHMDVNGTNRWIGRGARLLAVSLVPFVLLFVPCVFASPPAEVPVKDAGKLFGEDEVLAIGDGFVITGADVNALTEYMKGRGVVTVPDVQLEGYLKVYLFSREGDAIVSERIEQVNQEGQDQAAIDRAVEVSEGLLKLTPLDRMLFLSNLYWLKLAKDYELDDEVYESYYRTYPETFRKQDEETGESVDLPLDDQARGYIHHKVLLRKQKYLLKDALENLKKKYHVRQCSEGSEDPCQKL